MTAIRGDAPTPAITNAPPLTLLNKVLYGFGSCAYGIKNNGYDYFLLMFYSIVLGLDARLVGLALAIALVFDAISDPLVGYLSDNLRSKWGRRHPFMYAAAAPVAFFYFLLWQPPDGLSETQLFIYITLLSIFIRTLITFYETPSSALSPELTADYHARTSLLSFRYFFGWTGGNVMSVIMFGVLLVSTAEHPDGRFNPEGWHTYGLMASTLIFVSIIVSAMGTHSRIPYLIVPPKQTERMTLKKIVLDIIQTLSEKSFIALMLASLLGAIATGVAASMAFTILSFFWELSSEQLFILTGMVFVSAALSFIVTPIISRYLNKKRATLVLGSIAFGVSPVPVALRLLDLMPANGDPWLFPILVTVNTLDVALIISMQTTFASMVADLVEQNQIKTGHRSEGVFFASITFIRKCTQGIGVLIAGFIIEFSNFPKQTVASDISEQVLFDLGKLYVPTLWLLWGSMLVAISFYRIDQTKHEDNLRRLREQGAPTPAS